MYEDVEENRHGPEVYVGSAGPEASASSDRKKANHYLDYAGRAAEQNRLEAYFHNEKKKLEERLKYCAEAGDKEMADSVREDIIMLEEACRIVKAGMNIKGSINAAFLFTEQPIKNFISKDSLLFPAVFPAIEKICPECGTKYENNSSFCGNDGSLLKNSYLIPKCRCGKNLADSLLNNLKHCPLCGTKLKLSANICPECKQEYPPEIRFCGQDGHKLAAVKITPRCEKCGIMPAVKDGTKICFCPSCGSCLNAGFTYRKIADVENRISKKIYKAGDIISFGLYPYEADGAKKTLEWIVLNAEKDGTLFLLSRHGIEAMPYNDSYSAVSWECCALRQWLNKDFFSNAFNDREKAAVKTVQTETKKTFPFIRSAPVYDKVFILNAAEASRYFVSDEKRKCVPSLYAKMRGAYCSGGSCWWWLRSCGEDGAHAMYVSIGGNINSVGSNVSDAQGAVRAAVKINISLLRH